MSNMVKWYLNIWVRQTIVSQLQSEIVPIRFDEFA